MTVTQEVEKEVMRLMDEALLYQKIEDFEIQDPNCYQNSLLIL